jgi:hypothetical protein
MIADICNAVGLTLDAWLLTWSVHYSSSDCSIVSVSGFVIAPSSEPYPITTHSTVSGKNHRLIKPNMCPQVKLIAKKVNTLNVPALGASL